MDKSGSETLKNRIGWKREETGRKIKEKIISGKGNLKQGTNSYKMSALRAKHRVTKGGENITAGRWRYGSQNIDSCIFRGITVGGAGGGLLRCSSQKILSDVSQRNSEPISWAPVMRIRIHEFGQLRGAKYQRQGSFRYLFLKKKDSLQHLDGVFAFFEVRIL